MKINEFMTKVTKVTNAQIMKSILETKNYLSFSEKKALVERIIDKCKVEENGFVKINEIDKYIVFTTECISAYTCLEFSDDIESVMYEYDMLVENGLLNNIISTFETEYKIILELSSMQANYVLQNNSVEYQVAKLLNGVNGKFDGIIDVLKKKVDGFDLNNLDIPTGDIEKIMGFVKKYLK